jgi:hypothetical protein
MTAEHSSGITNNNFFTMIKRKDCESLSVRVRDILDYTGNKDGRV